MIFLQEEEEILITKRYGVGGGGVFDNQNIYGVGQARAQGERLGYQGADQQGEGHGDGCGQAGWLEAELCGRQDRLDLFQGSVELFITGDFWYK